jgi:hypothetical protein
MPRGKDKLLNTPNKQLESQGGVGGAIGGTRPSGMNRMGGGTVSHYGQDVKGSNLQYNFGNVPRPDVTGPNPGQYKFPGGYMDMTPAKPLTLWDRARLIFNRGR